jgi:hypothetical protein
MQTHMLPALLVGVVEKSTSRVRHARCSRTQLARPDGCVHPRVCGFRGHRDGKTQSVSVASQVSILAETLRTGMKA